jgi:hypothetical protein
VEIFVLFFKYSVHLSEQEEGAPSPWVNVHVTISTV